MAPGLLENVVKVTNLEVVKIVFRHLHFLSFLAFNASFLTPTNSREIPRGCAF